MSQRLAGDRLGVALVAHETTNHCPVLLLNPSLIILAVESRARELDMPLRAVVHQCVVEKRRVVDRCGNAISAGIVERSPLALGQIEHFGRAYGQWD